MLSGVSTEILRLLFPAAVEEITRKARPSSGRPRCCRAARRPATSPPGSRSGRAVAAVFAARAATDGMRNAVGTPRAVAGLRRRRHRARARSPGRASTRPPRPPMLPFFGQVRAWMMTPTDIAAERPAPPPSTSSAQMQQELAEVKTYVGQPHARAARDRPQVVGRRRHLHAARPLERHRGRVRPRRPLERGARRPRLRARSTWRMHDAAVGCWEAKYFYFNPRPTQLDPTLEDRASACPNFPAYTSGHSTFSARGRRGALVPLPGAARRVRGDAGRGGHLAALRRHPLPRGHRGRQGPRQADRRLHRRASRGRTARTRRPS